MAERPETHCLYNGWEFKFMQNTRRLCALPFFETAAHSPIEGGGSGAQFASRRAITEHFELETNTDGCSLKEERGGESG